MKITKLKCIFRYLSMVFVMIIWTGCASDGQKTDASGVGQKMHNFHSIVEQKMISLQKKLTSQDDSETTQAARDSQSDSVYFKHVTRYPSESLVCIAEWFTGDPDNWRSLAEANPNIDPGQIGVGTPVLIPENRMRTRADLPKEFAGRFGRTYFKHTVRWPGESLSLIARWYTGSSNNWRALARTNPSLDPNRIKPGDGIFIAPEALITREPLPQKVAAKYTHTYFAHTVKISGEKLVNIAHWYTGNPENWETLAAANPKLDPENLPVGTEVFIPAELLTTREPIPSDFGLTASPEGQREPPPAEASTKKKKDAPIHLFGPKQFPQG